MLIVTRNDIVFAVKTTASGGGGCATDLHHSARFVCTVTTLVYSPVTSSGLGSIQPSPSLFCAMFAHVAALAFVAVVTATATPTSSRITMENGVFAVEST